MKLIINVVLVFLLSVHIAVASEEQAPDRDQTITYINKIMQRLADKHIGYVTVTGAGTLDIFLGDEKRPLSYSDGTYSFIRRTISGPVKVGNKEGWFARYSKSVGIPIKNINRFSQGEEDDKNDNSSLLPGVGTFCVHFDMPYRRSEQSNVETSRYGQNTMYGIDQLPPTESTQSKMCLIYPAEDPNNFTRLQNAFLRLKEIESEVRDPFLD